MAQERRFSRQRAESGLEEKPGIQFAKSRVWPQRTEIPAVELGLSRDDVLNSGAQIMACEIMA